ncbi:P-loop containing nucleoside triphosphate hydrolase protein, partial [Phellopilus nigrolimitatus]
MVLTRERHNARGRQSSRPAKRAKLSHQPETAEVSKNDPNADIHVPKTREQKEEERRERLRQELLDQQSNSKFTSKKKRRLEKYIDKKLKKEERVQIFEKLAETQAQLPSTLQLQSSSTLGSRKVQTNEELQAKLEDKQIRRAMEGRVKGKRRRQNNAYSGIDRVSEDDEDEDIEMKEDLAPESGFSRSFPVIVRDEEPAIAPSKPALVVKDMAVGGALRKNADGTVSAPKVVNRKPRGHRTAFRGWGKALRVDKVEDASSSNDSSFDSSDSDHDSSEDDENVAEDEGIVEEGSEGGGSGDSTSSNSEGSEVEDGDKDPPILKRKRTGFKDWAMQQLSVAKGYVVPPSTPEDITTSELNSLKSDPVVKKPSKPRTGPREMRGPLGEDISLPDTALRQQLQPALPGCVDTPASSKPQKTASKFVSIERSVDVQAARLELPILAEEQPIVEAVRLNPVVVLCGATGSGKTTQVPQFLYEAGFGCPGGDNPGMIGITQPRRVAAMSMAARVGHELALPPSRVAYQVRYDATTAPTTAIKFMTDGVLLRELASDFTLSRYSVVVVDEAHERSVNTDILIGVLSRVVRLREELWKEGKEGAKPLRLIIMSATLRVSDFAENPTLFPTPPPVLRVDARQHPVAIHFARRTYSDYVSEAIKKTCKIHARLPPGGILIFLTGQNEIAGVCRKFDARFGKAAIAAKKRRHWPTTTRKEKESKPVDGTTNATKVAPAFADVEVEEMELGDFEDDHADIDDGDEPKNIDPEALDTEDEDDENRALGIDTEDSDVPMHVLPLYSILPTEQQMRVFETPPPGARLVVVATNVAETSLTIPGIRYVVDCGRAKERCYDTATGVQSFRVNWISKASADQRAGRAGRTGPGHCYRIYSSALFEHHFEQFARPEILQMPIEGVVLQMKSMHVDTVTNFPFPTPPDRMRLRKAEELLVHLGALAPSGALPRTPADGPITELGRAMALFPLSPRFAKMLVSGRQHGCLPYVIAIVAALSVGDPFIHEEALQADDGPDEDDLEELALVHSENVKAKELNKLRRRAFFKSQEWIHSRLGKSLSDVFRVLSVVGAYEFAGGGHQFCHDHFVRPKAMEEIHKLRAQISNIVSTNFSDRDAQFVRNLKPPNDLQIKVLRQLLCSAFIDQVAVRKDMIQNTAMSGNKYASTRGVPYRALGIDEDAFIHPGSVLFNKPPPDFIVFQEAVHSSQLWLRTLTVVNPAWLSALGKGSMCTFSKPTKNSSGDFM